MSAEDIFNAKPIEERREIFAALEAVADRAKCSKGKPCKSCPFNDGLTEEASYVQNMGCLPNQYDILQIKEETGKHWACHGNMDLTCGGLTQHFTKKGIKIDTTVELHTEEGVHF